MHTLGRGVCESQRATERQRERERSGAKQSGLSVRLGDSFTQQALKGIPVACRPNTLAAVYWIYITWIYRKRILLQL